MKTGCRRRRREVHVFRDADSCHWVVASGHRGVSRHQTQCTAVVRAVTHGRDGLLVERKSRRQLSYALQTLINNPALRQEMGQAGLQKARRYDWERVIDEVTDVYHQALDQAQPAPSIRLEHSLSPR